jgi:ubiquinone biosynthesis protein UbiJ
VNPVSGLTELIRLLRLGAQTKTSRTAGHVSAQPQKKNLREGSPQAESLEQLMGKLKSRISEMTESGTPFNPVDLFVETVLEWKLRDLDGGLDLHGLAAQVREIISADPDVKTKLENLLRKL